MKRLTAWLAALAAVACATGAAGQDIKIRFAHSLSATEPAHLAAEFFARNVAARTSGRVQIQVFPGEQLVPGKEVNEMIRQGANVMNITDPGYLSDCVGAQRPLPRQGSQGLRAAACVGLVQGH